MNYSSRYRKPRPFLIRDNLFAINRDTQCRTLIEKTPSYSRTIARDNLVLILLRETSPSYSYRQRQHSPFLQKETTPSYFNFIAAEPLLSNLYVSYFFSNRPAKKRLTIHPSVQCPDSRGRGGEMAFPYLPTSLDIK